MARQKGPFKASGTISDVVFYKSKFGYILRSKGSLNRKRIQKDPAFSRTRENNSEFITATKGVKTLRSAFRSLIHSVSHPFLAGRLTREMVRIIRADLIHDRGKRVIANENLVLLEGFDFNPEAPITKILFAPYKITINQEKGELLVIFPPFVSRESIKAPSKTAYFKITVAIAEIDFEKKAFVFNQQETDAMCANGDLIPEIRFMQNITADSKLPVFVLIGVSFYQLVNGNAYSLNDGKFNCLSIAKVDRGLRGF